MLNVDNVVRPILIQRGAKLPLMLIFVGVIGGLIAFGMVGIFVGPVVLAVTYELFARVGESGGARRDGCRNGGSGRRGARGSAAAGTSGRLIAGQATVRESRMYSPR